MKRPNKVPILLIIAMIGFLVFLVLISPAQSSRKQAIKFNKFGKSAFKENDYQKALKNFELSIKADPSFDKAHANLAELYYSLHRSKDAIMEYQRAIKANPKDPSHYLRLGALFYEDKEYNKAIETLKKARKLAEQEPKVYFFLGMTYFAMDDLDKAKENLNVLINMKQANETDMLKAHKVLGKVYLKKKDWENARLHFKIILDSNKASIIMKRSIKEEYKYVDRQLSVSKYGISAILVFVFVAIILFLFWRFIQKQQEGKTPISKLPSSASDAKDYDTLATYAVQHLKVLTKLPKALVYFVRREGQPLYLALADNLEREKYDDLDVDWDELSNWLTVNQGKPFIYNIEKKEPPFMRAFPKSRDRLDVAETRVGIPFVYQNVFRGVAFMASPKIKDMMKLRRYYEKNTETIRKTSLEVGAASEKIYQKESTTTDSVTPAYNQLYFKEKLPEEVARCRDSHNTLALIMFEIDRIIAIQKRFGEERKNYVLKTLIQSLQKYLNPSKELVFRISDYRFAIILCDIDNDSTLDKAHYLLDIISKTQFTTPIPNVTASMGMAIFPKQASTAKALDQEARNALDQAISTGRNKLVFEMKTAGLRPSIVQTVERESIENISAQETSSGSLRGIHIVSAKEKSRSSIPIAPPSAGKSTEESGRAKASKSPFKFRSAQKTQPEPPSRQTISRIEDKPEILTNVPNEEIQRSDTKKERLWKPRKATKSRHSAGSSRKESRDFVPIKPGTVKTRETGTPSRVSPPPWMKGKSTTVKTDKREKIETSVLRRPPKMREVGSSTSKLPPLPKSSQGLKPMRGLIRRSKSSAQMPGVRRRTGGATLRPYPGKKAGKSTEEKPVRSISRKQQETQEIPSHLKKIEKMKQKQADSKGRVKPIAPSIAPRRPFAKKKKEPRVIDRIPVAGTEPPIASATPSKRRPPTQIGTSQLPRLGMKSFKPSKKSSKVKSKTTQATQAAILRKKTQSKIAKDPITGFFYKSYFEQSIKRLMISASQTKRPLTLLFFKLDKHKELKGKYGQEKLNNVLKEITSMIGNFLKEGSDVPARYSEEIFVTILPDTTHQIAFNLGEQIRFTIGNLTFRDVPGNVTLSLGIASFPNKGKSPKEVMKNSYDAMVYAIKSGGNKSVIWNETLLKRKV
ncbi:MAG: diguanylate cyclase [Candidatus Eremiobacteraeota bacterium]|nr:diguanylate cyclase [Candidatus Eremiobacteraeota bacterium]